jgi:hypothetical protein
MVDIKRACAGFTFASVGLMAGCSGSGLQPPPSASIFQNVGGHGHIFRAASSGYDPSVSKLAAIVGRGTGMVIVAPTAKDDGTFSAEITINVQGAAPNTTFLVQRAPDLIPNGVCTGTYLKNVGITLTTDSAGSGATHFFFERGVPFVSGVQFDVVFQVYTADFSTILQSQCMTVTVK